MQIKLWPHSFILLSFYGLRLYFQAGGAAASAPAGLTETCAYRSALHIASTCTSKISRYPVWLLVDIRSTGGKYPQRGDALPYFFFTSLGATPKYFRNSLLKA